MDNSPSPDPQFLFAMMRMKMPFGKYKDQYLHKLPVSYLEWFERKGFPKGKLGDMLRSMHEIKINGLEDLLKALLP